MLKEVVRKLARSIILENREGVPLNEELTVYGVRDLQVALRKTPGGKTTLDVLHFDFAGNSFLVDAEGEVAVEEDGEVALVLEDGRFKNILEDYLAARLEWFTEEEQRRKAAGG